MLLVVAVAGGVITAALAAFLSYMDMKAPPANGKQDKKEK